MPDFIDIYSFLKEADKLKDLGNLTKKYSDPKPNSYLSFINSKLDDIKRAQEEYNVPIPEARKKFVDDINHIKRGEKKELAIILIEWFWEEHASALSEFLKSCGYDTAKLTPDISSVTYDCFICWTGAYGREIAISLRSFFSKYDDQLKVFVSAKDIQADHWEPALKEGLRYSARGLVIVTQDILDSDYFDHEFGILATKNIPPKILRVKTPVKALSKPMQSYQSQDFSFEEARTWIIQTFTQLGVNFESEDFDILKNELDELSSRFDGDYVDIDEDLWAENYGRPILMASQNDSPFDLQQLLKMAKQKIIMVAQNHYYVTSNRDDGSERFWPLIESALLRGVDIDIVGMHTDVLPKVRDEIKNSVPSAVDVWSHYMNAAAFEEHLDECWETLQIWSSRYQELRSASSGHIGTLKLVGAYFTPLTVTIVDPELPTGFLVLSPRTGHEASEPRPHFILRRRYENKAFNYYHKTVTNGLANGGWQRLFVG